MIIYQFLRRIYTYITLCFTQSFFSAICRLYFFKTIIPLGSIYTSCQSATYPPPIYMGQMMNKLVLSLAIEKVNSTLDIKWSAPKCLWSKKTIYFHKMMLYPLLQASTLFPRNNVLVRNFLI